MMMDLMGSKCKVLYVMSPDDAITGEDDQSFNENKGGGHPNIESKIFELYFLDDEIGKETQSWR